LKNKEIWIPAFAGMTVDAREYM